MAAASAAPLAAVNGLKMATASQAYLESIPVKESKALISELCRQFYNLGWVSGTGGSITIKVHDDSIPKPDQLIVMTPSGVQKERMIPEDMYVLSPTGSIESSPSPKPYPHKPPKCSDCAPLFLKFSPTDPNKLMVISPDSKVCILNGIDVIFKCWGLCNAGS